jgi:hypothetical protein
MLVVYEGGDWCGLCMQPVRGRLCTHERRVAWRFAQSRALSNFHQKKAGTKQPDTMEGLLGLVLAD